MCVCVCVCDRFLAHASCTAVSLSKHVLSLGVGWLLGGELFQSLGTRVFTTVMCLVKKIIVFNTIDEIMLMFNCDMCYGINVYIYVQL